jgi:hypothetical protein
MALTEGQAFSEKQGNANHFSATYFWSLEASMSWSKPGVGKTPPKMLVGKPRITCNYSHLSFMGSRARRVQELFQYLEE